jgi:hypothetical protein
MGLDMASVPEMSSDCERIFRSVTDDYGLKVDIVEVLERKG